jgi:DNA-binding response OmpR family regulator
LRISNFVRDALVRALIAEDDPGVQRFVVKGLEDQACAVDAVSTGIGASHRAA